MPHTGSKHEVPIGCSIDELDTPALCIDIERMDKNIQRMVELCRQHHVAWRPHIKGHKSPIIAARQIAAGASGITCAKLGEAEVMADAGIRDILIANQIVGPHKMRRLAALAHRADLIVAIDDVAQVDAMASAIEPGARLRVIIEVNLGMDRAGVAPGEATLQLAQAAARSPRLEFAGIMGYEGHLLTLPDRDEKAARIRASMQELAATRQLLLDHGLPCPIVSAGGTGSIAVTMACEGVTELQAGGLIFMDAFYRHRCQVAEFDFALTLVATVVSRPAPDRAIIDAGRKSQHADFHPSLVVGRDDIRVEQLSAEHGRLRLEPSAQDLRVGDRLQLIPGYADFTCVLHDEFYALRNGRLEAIWPLEARGRIR